MTDAQRHLFGHKLAHDERVSSDYSHLVGTGSYEDFANYWRICLQKNSILKCSIRYL